jgi:hypothetical protein
VTGKTKQNKHTPVNTKAAKPRARRRPRDVVERRAVVSRMPGYQGMGVRKRFLEEKTNPLCGRKKRDIIMIVS